MIKQTLLAILFFTCSIAFSQDLNITNNLPASANAGDAIDAQFTLTKGATMGSFAKFQLDLPAGFQAQSTDIKGGNFTFENNRVKIVWVSLPGDASFTFSFKLTASSTVPGNVNIAPQFFYLENSVKKEFNPTPAVINFGGSAAVAAPDNTTISTPPATDNTSTSTPPATDNTATTSTPSDNTATNTVAVPSETVAATTTTEPATTNSTPATTAPVETAKTTGSATTTQPAAVKTNVIYYVQLAALTIKPNKSRFAKYGTVKIVEEAGLYKVLVGNYKTLEDARKYKAQLLAKGTVGCFVVAYENGVHIKI